MILEHIKSKQTILVANTQLKGGDNYDPVRQAQTLFLMEHAAAMMRKHQLNKYMKDKAVKHKLPEKEKKRIQNMPMPFIMGCDLNSSPDAAACNILVGEEFTHTDLFHKGQVSEDIKELYEMVEQNFESQMKSGKLEPLINKLSSVYLKCPYSHG